MNPGPDMEEPPEPREANGPPESSPEAGGRPSWINGVEEKADRHGDNEKRVDLRPEHDVGEGG